MIPLEKKRFNILIEPLKRVTINISFAHSVAENCVSGKIYVDKWDDPKTFYIVHPYGLSLLLGDCDNNDFNNNFRDYALNTHKIRKNQEWMQAYPANWDKTLKGLFKNHMITSSENIDHKEEMVEINTRVNFKFNRVKYGDFKRNNAANLRIFRTDEQTFRHMKGSVIPLSFWDNPNEFAKKGVGFSAFYENRLASTAFSACISDNKLEIGIETVDEFRGKGFAQYSCSRLIDYCIANNYEPVWSCKLENIGSYKLAQKLGFEPTLTWPFYRLP